MNRRRFFQFMAAGLLAAQLHLPFGGLPKIAEAPTGNVLTIEMLRRAVQLMKQTMAYEPERSIIWCHPRDEKWYREVLDECR